MREITFSVCIDRSSGMDSRGGGRVKAGRATEGKIAEK